MIKSIKTIMRQDREPYRIPRRVQDVIPIQCVWPDGIFKVGNQPSQENLSAHLPAPTESAPPLPIPSETQNTDEPVLRESAPPLPSPTAVSESDKPEQAVPTPAPIFDNSAPTESIPPSASPTASVPDSSGSAESTPQPSPTPTPALDTPKPTGEGWALTLFNWEHPLPDSYIIPEFTQLRNGHAIDSRAYLALQAMMDNARAVGLQPLICSSYRTWDTQNQLFENEVQNWLGRGYTREEAENHAAMWVARPGTSEHQTGLAVDIVDMSYQILDNEQENTAVQRWLMAHCADYGFILRYPTDKSSLTGVNYEPWHYRYVGTPAAKEIMDGGLCLEEYLQQ